jgi:biopolymer transport protein ExbB
MISKILTIAAAVVLVSGLSIASVAPAFAQDNAAPAAAAPAADASAPAAPAADASAPAPASTNKAAAAIAAGEQSTPYGLTHIWMTGSMVARFIIVVLAIMSAGTWYIFITKFIEQQRVLNHSKLLEKKFWAASNLNEGIEGLPKNSLFRAIAESGVKASTNTTSLVGVSDWIGMQISHQLEDANAALAGGISFLGSVGSVSPFVGLFGTVWGILQALIAIGVAGQASIDKVAGPVGEALVMTALGLAVAVPAVLLYNYLVRRNKVIAEKLKGFAGDLQTYLVSKK